MVADDRHHCRLESLVFVRGLSRDTFELSFGSGRRMAMMDVNLSTISLNFASKKSVQICSTLKFATEVMCVRGQWEGGVELSVL